MVNSISLEVFIVSEGAGNQDHDVFVIVSVYFDNTV